MAPAKLMIKDGRGELVPFEVDGVEWIDGSVQADLPFKRISTLFNILNFVVAQTNFHVVPFLNQSHHPNIVSASPFMTARSYVELPMFAFPEHPLLEDISDVDVGRSVTSS
jgi:hypothetical protein